MKSKSKKFAVILLSMAMLMSQMSVFSFALEDETAPAQEQPAVEQTVEEEAPAVAEEPATVEAEPAKVEEAAPAEETAAPAPVPAQTEEAKAVVNEPAKEEPVEEAFSASKTVDGVVVSVKAAKGVFPAGSTLSVKKVAKPASVDTADAAKAYAFDITIKDAEGNEIQPDGKAEVSFKTAEVAKYDTEVYHISDAGKVDALGVDESGKTATVETKGFSTYVLVFTSEAGAGSSKIDYSMGDNQEVELQKIVGSYRPILGGAYSTFGAYDYSDAKVDLSSKIELFDNGAGNRAIRVKSNATFDNGEEATLTIPYTYTYKESSEGTGTEKTGTLTITITVTDTSAPGTIVEPKAKEGLVYSGSAQQIITAGKTSVGTMEYMVESGDWTASTDASEAVLKKTDAGDYTVYWRVVLTNGTKKTTVQSGSFTATINKKAATLTINGGTSAFDGNAVTLTAANAGVVEDTGARLELGTDYKLVSTPSVIKEVGKYTVDAEVIDTSDKLKNFDLTIVPGTYTVTDKPSSQITYTVTNSNGSSTPASYVKDFEWVYDGAKHGIFVNVTAPTTATVYYSRTMLNAGNVATDGDTNPENVYPTDAGTYPIYFYIIADGYTPVAGSRTVKIDQAYLRATINLPKTNVTYGDTVDFANQSWQAAIDAGNVTFKAYKDQAESAGNELDVDFSTISNLDQLAFNMGGYTDYMSDAGKYTIKLEQNLTSDNYIIRCTDGVLTVNPKPVSFTWSTPTEWTYDGQEHSVSAKINQDTLVGSDKEAGQVTINYVDDQAAYTNTATEVLRADDWSVDFYVAKVLSLDGPRGHNYTFTVTPKASEKTDEHGTDVCPFKINPVELTMTPNAVTTVYGEAAECDGYTAKTFVNGEDESVIIGTPEYKFYKADGTTEYAPGNPVASNYVVKFDATKFNTKAGLHAQNYQLKDEAGTMEVIQREVTFNWSTPKSFEYDGDEHEVVVTSVTNDFGTEAKDNLSYEENKKTHAGSYTAVASLKTDIAANYKILDDSDKYAWEITKRPATIHANNKTITYGQAPDNAGYYIDNMPLVDGDSIGDVRFTYNYVKNGKPGYYSITPVVDNLNPDYYIANTVAGTLTVNDVPGMLVAQGTKAGSRGIRISWNSVTGAASYDVYASLCNSKKKVYTPAYVATTSGNSYKLTKLGKKKLKKHTCYKYYVVAKDASGKVIATSAMGHFITGNKKGKTVNAKSMSVNTSAITLTRGGTAKINASYTKAKKGKKYKLLNSSHEALTRYISTNTAVATVDANGYVYAAGSGYCKVYVLGVSGMWRVVEVYVN